MTFSPKIIHALPKTDLHLHLDGSLRLSTLIELAKTNNVTLPSYTESGLKELVFKETYKNLEEYLKGFALILQVLLNPENLERCAYELACDCIADGIWYCEVRFAPQLHAIPQTMSLQEVLEAVDRGFARAAREQQAQNKNPFSYGIIACAMRFFERSYSQYFADFLGNDLVANEHQLHNAALQLAHAIVAIRDNTAVPIVALDIAGLERGWHPHTFQDAFAYIQNHFLCATIHAGEDDGAQSIYNAITILHAERVGHALNLFDTTKLNLPSIKHKEIFLERLASFMAKQNITIETCISSNLQTSPTLTLETHLTHELLRREMPFTLCTDNRLISNTNICKEYELLISTNKLTAEPLKKVIMTGFRNSFFPGTYQEKEAFIARAKEQLEQILKTA